MPIDTDKFSHKLRNKGINIPDRKILVTNFNNSLQEKDFSVPSNCGGFGRIRHFRTDSNSQWGVNPLPIYPALKALNRSDTEQIKAQVFQNAICNWRCWYCYVDFKLLSGDLRYSEYLSCDELLDLFLLEDNRPDMIDLSGGQPDLTPEWVPWMMQVLIDRGMDNNIYLWSDDNLSNDYFWRYLSDSQIDLVSNYKMYGRVCCDSAP